MRRFSPTKLRALGVKIFTRLGASVEEARIITEHLVCASLMGVDSHGVIRYAKYIDETLQGIINPRSKIKVIRETQSTGIVDGGFTFGILTADFAANLAADKAAVNGVSFVVCRHTHHVGRLGAHVQRVAEKQLIALGFAAANTRYSDRQRVAPWGSRQGRIGTNPLAYAIPGGDDPIVFDMSTAMIPMGKVHNLRRTGRPVPENMIQDEAGRPTTDPEVLFEPFQGSLLPFGGKRGYKGFGLALLCEILTGCLNGDDPGVADTEKHYANDLSIIAVDPRNFIDTGAFDQRMQDYCDYITASAPAVGYHEVVMPGTIERRTREMRAAEGIPLEEEAVSTMAEAAARIGIDISEELPPI